MFGFMIAKVSKAGILPRIGPVKSVIPPLAAMVVGLVLKAIAMVNGI
jgi:hypothetical protein